MKRQVIAVAALAAAFCFSACNEPNKTISGPDPGESEGSGDPGAGVDPQPEIYLYRYTPDMVGTFFPQWIGGDREFAGNGPVVDFSGSLSHDETKVYLHLAMHAKETTSDWTEARGTWTVPIFTVPSGNTIVEIVSHGGVSTCSYTDTDHDPDYCFASSGPVAYFRAMGDTGGNDVGNTTSDDTHCSVQLRAVELRIQRAG